jgi:hypothetical protein
MTDNEIIKALECCHITCGCSECAYVDCPEDCVETMKLDALNLINRQQAVIDRYEEDIERLRTALIQEVMDRDDAKAEAICSECGREVVYQIIDNKWRFENFCPHCGADMRKEGADNV